jgi:hypothetical protein
LTGRRINCLMCFSATARVYRRCFPTFLHCLSLAKFCRMLDSCLHISACALHPRCLNVTSDRGTPHRMRSPHLRSPSELDEFRTNFSPSVFLFPLNTKKVVFFMLEGAPMMGLSWPSKSVSLPRSLMTRPKEHSDHPNSCHHSLEAPRRPARPRKPEQ